MTDLSYSVSRPPEVKVTQHGPGPHTYQKSMLTLSHAIVSIINYLVKLMECGPKLPALKKKKKTLLSGRIKVQRLSPRS